MSHLKLVIAYREHLNDIGVTCMGNQNKACSEAYVRALLKYNSRFCDSLSFSEATEELIWRQLDRWNSVSPINGRFILEAAKGRLYQIRKELIECGTVKNGDLSAVTVDITKHTDEGETQVKCDLTDYEPFGHLVNYLYGELVKGNE